MRRYFWTMLCLALGTLLWVPSGPAAGQDGTTVGANGIRATLPDGWVADTDDAPNLILMASGSESLTATRPVAGQRLMVLTITPAKPNESLDDVVATMIVEYDPAFAIAVFDLGTIEARLSGLAASRSGLVQANIGDGEFFLRATAARLANFDIEILLISNGPMTGEEADQLLDAVAIDTTLLLSFLDPTAVITRLADDGPHSLLATSRISDILPVPMQLSIPFGWDGVANPNLIAVASNRGVLDYLQAGDYSQPLAVAGVGWIMRPVPTNLYEPDTPLTALTDLMTRRESNQAYTFDDSSLTTLFGYDAAEVTFSWADGHGTYAVVLFGDVILELWIIDTVTDSGRAPIVAAIFEQAEIEGSLLLTLPQQFNFVQTLGLREITFRTPRDWMVNDEQYYLLIYDNPSVPGAFANLDLTAPDSLDGRFLVVSGVPKSSFGAGVSTPYDVLVASGWSREGWLYPTTDPIELTYNDRAVLMVTFETPLATAYIFILESDNHWLIMNTLATTGTFEENTALFQAIISTMIVS